MKNSNHYLLSFKEIDKTTLAMVGGKGANLAELSVIAQIQVPEGFCITTLVYQEIIALSKVSRSLLGQLSILKADNRQIISEISARIRKEIEKIEIPEIIRREIIQSIEQTGGESAYAIRSSASAEDLPEASFAGQQDTYLNIIGIESILKHISKCFASLFTERAIVYRIQNGFDHEKVQLSVIVQKMVLSQVSGIMFCADPVNSNRKVVVIDASFGLGESIVAGLVNADTYKVRDGKIIEKLISTKKMSTYALAAGGTKEKQIDPEWQNRQALTDHQILHLEHIGRKIETHFGCPQDIEWCLSDGKFHVVQSRPITTLYPIPEANDRKKHVYISVGHQQMMTDPMKPLGLSLWQLIAFRPMFKSAGRLFIDVMQQLGSSDSREILLDAMGRHDPLIKDGLLRLIEEGDFIEPLPGDDTGKSNKASASSPYAMEIDNDPEIVSTLIERSEATVKVLKQQIKAKTGTDLLDFIMEDIKELKASLFNQQNMAVLTAAMNASSWINENMKVWLGEKNAADLLSQSVPNNITAEMGMGLMDVADLIRPQQEVIDYLRRIKDDFCLHDLLKLNGGKESWEAINSFLNKYGMRCAGEIDITKTRWTEKPGILISMILANIKNFQPGASKHKFELGRQGALNKKKELLDKLSQLSDAEQKISETKQMIDLMRNFAGYREYPKYSIVSRIFVYKQALLKEAEQLVIAEIIQEKEDIYYLTFEELHEVVSGNKLDQQIIVQRKEDYSAYEKLSPPRVITSEGEIVRGAYPRENLPEDAIMGLAVSSGLAEGRARVILNMENANLEEGDILVTTFTDPSWTLLFVSIKGLVTEVGGLMTHGAVIAREYGLPTVVGAENATKLIKDGQIIRVNGTAGYIEIL